MMHLASDRLALWQRFVPGRALLAVCLGPLALSGCVRDIDYQTISGEGLYQARCATCHGQTGIGDGPASRGLQPQPRNLRTAAWQDAVSDDHLRASILSGGASVGKSSRMPPQPDLARHPEALEKLVKHLRSLRDVPISAPPAAR